MTKFNRGYEDLKVWRKAIELAKQVYLLTRKFPAEEKFGLISQMRSSSVSIASNIAEGCARNGAKEFIHFLGIACGSTAELKTQIIIALEVEIIAKEQAEPILFQAEEVEKMLSSLTRSLREKPAEMQLATHN